jgi:hypothetical protein
MFQLPTLCLLCGLEDDVAVTTFTDRFGRQAVFVGQFVDYTTIGGIHGL